MALYLMLTSLTEKGRQTLNANPARLREVNRDVEALGAKVLHQWASLGEYDFVNVVEAPDELTMARLSLSSVHAGASSSRRCRCSRWTTSWARSRARRRGSRSRAR